MYLVTGYFLFKPESRIRGLEILAQITELGLTEEGIHKYSYYQDPKDENRYFLYEEWETKAAHDAHFGSDAIQAIVPEFFSLMAEPAEVIYFDATEESRI
jgi:quinol monooxygenase YgiN